MKKIVLIAAGLMVLTSAGAFAQSTSGASGSSSGDTTMTDGNHAAGGGSRNGDHGN